MSNLPVGKDDSTAPTQLAKPPGAVARVQVAGLIYVRKIRHVIQAYPHLKLTTAFPNPDKSPLDDFVDIKELRTIVFHVYYNSIRSTEEDAVLAVKNVLDRICDTTKPYQILYLGDAIIPLASAPAPILEVLREEAKRKTEAATAVKNSPATAAVGQTPNLGNDQATAVNKSNAHATSRVDCKKTIRPKTTIQLPALSTATAATSSPIVADPLAALSPALAFHDRCFVDRDVLQVFERVAGSRGLFQGAHSWPWLTDISKKLTTAATAANATVDEAACREELQAIIGSAGGVLHRHKEGKIWAVRFLHAGAGKYLAVGFSITPTASVAGASGTGGAEAKDIPTLTDSAMRQRVENELKKLRLAKMARQILWLLHAGLLRQETSVVTLADVECGLAIWGPNRAAWPQNWRNDVVRAMQSLTVIRWRVFDSAVAGLRTFLLNNPDARSLVDVTTDFKASTAGLNCCEPRRCILHGTSTSHRHLQVTLGNAFLGTLQRLETNEPGKFNFNETRREALRKARKRAEAAIGSMRMQAKVRREQIDHQIVTAKAFFKQQHEALAPVPLATLILGDHLPLSESHRHLLCALIRETTHAQKQGRRRTDRAHVIVGAGVAGRNPRLETVCPYLDKTRGYVGFNGNSKVWGIGYRVVTWMHRSGYIEAVSAIPSLTAMRAFLRNLDQLASKFGLVVTSLYNGVWYDHAALMHLKVSELTQLTLRVYTLADYDQRWRQMLANAMKRVKKESKSKETVTRPTPTQAQNEPSSKSEESPTVESAAELGKANEESA